MDADSLENKGLNELQEGKVRRERDLLEVSGESTGAFSLADDSKVLNGRWSQSIEPDSWFM